jgi:Holliday junction resolvase RusA-like endonuclease
MPDMAAPQVSEQIEFTVEGRPIAQPRPRVFKAGGVATDNARSLAWKSLIGYSFIEAHQGRRPRFPKPYALKVKALFMFKRPARPKYAKPIGPPDVDNLAKAVKDALKGLAWDDDAQVCSLIAEKDYSNWNGVLVTITAL